MNSLWYIHGLGSRMFNRPPFDKNWGHHFFSNIFFLNSKHQNFSPQKKRCGDPVGPLERQRGVSVAPCTGGCRRWWSMATSYNPDHRGYTDPWVRRGREFTRQDAVDELASWNKNGLYIIYILGWWMEISVLGISIGYIYV